MSGFTERMNTMSCFSLRALMMVAVSLLGIVFATAVDAYVLELQIEGDKLSIKADRVPLQELLMRVSDFGITVRIDPDINPVTSASFKNKNIQDGLKSILSPLNSIFIWNQTAPKGAKQQKPVYNLSEIQIFKPGKKERMVYLDQETDEAAEQVPEETVLPPENYQTKVVIKANRVFVPVLLTHGGKNIEATLIFDTGAGNIVLHQDIADSLGMFDYNPAKGRGVGGIEIDAKVSRLDAIKVGPYAKQNLRVAIVEYQGERTEVYHGLLGMNFLRGLKYEIDFENQLIKWGEPINRQEAEPSKGEQSPEEVQSSEEAEKPEDTQDLEYSEVFGEQL